VRWRALELAPVEAGARQLATVEAENAGSAPWRTRGARDGLFLAYHWLDERGNAIVWDGERTPLETAIEPGGTLRQTVAVRGPIPPGRYRLAIDLVEENRFWLAELGNDALERNVEVERRDPTGARAFLADGAAPPGDWLERARALHEEGYAAVGGAIETAGGRFRRPPPGAYGASSAGGRRKRPPAVSIAPPTAAYQIGRASCRERV